MLDMLARERLAPLWVHASVVLAWLAVFLPANFWFGPSQVWLPLREASRGLVYPALIVGLACMLLVVGVVLISIGRFRPRELGLELSKLPDAIVYTLLVWTLMQLSAIALSRFAGETPQLVPGLDGSGAGNLAGALVAQLFGNALCEEVLWLRVLLALRPNRQPAVCRRRTRTGERAHDARYRARRRRVPAAVTNAGRRHRTCMASTAGTRAHPSNATAFGRASFAINCVTSSGALRPPVLLKSPCLGRLLGDTRRIDSSIGTAKRASLQLRNGTPSFSEGR
jgi:hypothetical protein